jgi:hypothetical protein
MNHLSLLLCLLSILIIKSAHAELITELGQRDSRCTKESADSFEVVVPEILKLETQNQASQDLLKQLIVPSPHCFRVGTEAKVLFENTEIALLGRGFISSIENLSKNDLRKKNLNFSKTSILDYIKQHPSNEYSILNIDISEKVFETTVHNKFQKLPTCFPTYGDWETYLLPDLKADDLLQKIKSGKIKAQIKNGTFNCYKIGVSAHLVDSKGHTNDFGSIVPKELYLVHYSNLNEIHAQLLGEDLISLKKRMSENKNKDGGYTNIVVFDYLPPEQISQSTR